MTIQAAKNRAVSWALAQVGYREGANNWNKYAQGMQTAFGWNVQNNPWCQVFVVAVFAQTFGLQTAARMLYQTVGRFTALCVDAANYYKRNGAWFTKPEIGDQVFYFINGKIDHTGLVVEVRDGYVVCVEGNSSDMVARYHYAIGSPKIAGYGRPNWSAGADAADPKPETPESPAQEAAAPEEPAQPAFEYCDYTYQVPIHLLKIGCYGPQVQRLQTLLDSAGFPCDPDGKFGDNTRKALTDFQEAAGIPADGEFGGQSFAALWNYQK